MVSNVIDPISIADPVELTYNNATHKGSVSTIKLTDGNANLDISEIRIAPNSVSAIVDLNKLQLKLLKSTYQRQFCFRSFIITFRDQC